MTRGLCLRNSIPLFFFSSLRLRRFLSRIGLIRSSVNLRYALKPFSIIVFVLAVLFQPSWLHGQSANTSGTPILEQAIANSGGRAAWGTLKDFHATAFMSLYSSGSVTQSGRVEMVGRGLKEFKLTANLGDLNRTWLWNEGFGRLDTGDGRPGVIGRHNLTALEGFNLPMLKVIGLENGAPRLVTLVGAEAAEGVPAYRVRIATEASNHDDKIALGRPSFRLDLIIDQKTFAVLAVEDTIYPNNQPQNPFQHRVNYSDYRTVAGVQIPFKITEEISGQMTWALELDSFTANSGVPESEFLPQ